MLFDNERQDFSVLLDELGEHYGRRVSGSTKLMWWRLLADKLDLASLRQALDRHLLDRTRGRFFPQPSDVLAELERMGGGRPSADEAWALALETFDEGATVCVTDEILLAAVVASPVWESGDKVGARMAFKAAYERVVDERRLQGQRPCWQLSLGWDAQRRDLAARVGLEAGRLSLEQARPFLASPEPAAHAGRGQVLALPLDAAAMQRQRLRALREFLDGRRARCGEETEETEGGGTPDALMSPERERPAQPVRQIKTDRERLARREPS